MRRSTTLTLAKVVLTAGLLAYLVYLIEPVRLWKTAQQANLWWILAALALLPVNLLLEARLWQKMARTVVPEVTFRRALTSLLCGHPLGTFTPARVGELAGRAFYLRHPDKWELGTVVFAHRMLDMVIGIDAGLLALYYFITHYAPTPASVWWSIAVLGTGVALVLTAGALRPNWARRAVYWITAHPKVRRRVRFLRRLSSRQAAMALAWALARYVVYVTQYVLLVYAFDASLAVLAGYLGVMLIMYARFLIPSLTFMDIGIREGAAVFFLSTLGTSQAIAFNASFLLFFVNFLMPAALGLPFVLRLRLARRETVPTPDADRT